MAITVTNGNPIKVTGTGAGTITAAQVGVRAIRWIGATTNAHAATLTDTAGAEKWSSKAATAGLGIDTESSVGFSALGLKTSALESGTLYIYTD